MLLAAMAMLLLACGPASRNEHHGDDDDDGDGGVVLADAGCKSAITGKVFAPNGTLPLYNVQVYVPLSDPGPFPDGVQCTRCASNLPGGALTSAVTDSSGAFRLEGVPTDRDFSVIVTTGKWRRQVTIPRVAECQDTAMPDGTFRLPKNRTEGDIPRIAVVTGGCDPLACILPKIGIDATEFSDRSSSDARVVFYNGDGGSAPGAPLSMTALWGSLDEMKKFDIIINSCECDESNDYKLAPDLLRQYADMGGRVLGSHYHYTWMKNLIPAWQGVASWVGGSGVADRIDMSFAKGKAFAEWLVTAGASPSLGVIELGHKTYDAGAVNAPTSRWLYSPSANGGLETTNYLSFDTPVGVMPEQQCGKVVFAGMHVSSGTVGASFPTSCSASFSADEKALVFLLFDLSACVGVIF
ncbi:MAG: carboxypeptidase-like regulatory domain-containing protein [Kofleriaceae bacterium]